MSAPVRIGTRGSRLALWQANEVARLLHEVGCTTEIVALRTTGDRRTDVALAAIGGKGLFIKELEEALVSGRIDVAVHSLKDVPSLLPDEFELGAFLERADARDAWVRAAGGTIGELPEGSVVGTSSPRRAAQVLARWPGLRVEPLRGNVETRLAKQRDGQYDGIVLASAGLGRLGLAASATSLFDLDEIVPAAGQGIVTVEILRERDDLRALLRRINHEPSEEAALAERGVLQKFGTRLDCYSPIAVHATIHDGEIEIRAFLSDLEGRDAIRVHERGEARAVVRAVHEQLVARGGLDLLARASRG
ncbi:MAG: hydroxymethylbilane synthase [Thermoanaerobaculia bacterium]